MDDRLRLYSQREVQELYKTGRKIFGAPLPLPHPKARTLPNEDMLKGQIGEHAVSGILNLLTLSYPELFVFHSVGISDKEDGETDHIVIYKNKIFVIETKNYSNFTSIFASQDGTTSGKKRGQLIPVNDNGILNKQQLYQRKYPTMEVEAVLVITQPNIKTGSSYPGYAVVGIRELMTYIEKKAASASAVDEGLTTFLVKRFANLCIRNEVYN